MPSFAFWKGSKQEEVKSTIPNDSVPEPKPVAAEQAAARKLDLEPGERDSGAFTFEDMERLAQCSPATPLQQLIDFVTPSTVSSTIGQVDTDAALLDDEDIQSQCGSSELGPEDGIKSPSVSESHAPQSWKGPVSLEERESVKETSIDPLTVSMAPLRPAPAPPRPAPSRPAPSRPAPSRPAPAPPVQSLSESRPPSFALRADLSAKRLHRPTELNLSKTMSDTSKPQSELEKRFNSMRDSKNQLKAALRSPTQLLKERLNMSPRKSTYEEKIHAFVPPPPSSNGCLLPGPAGQMEAFTSTSVRARTSAGGRPAWWCKFDKLVVFDGINVQEDGELKIQTRTSKGLSIARRRGDTEMIIIPMDCEHCQEMLNRHEWKYDIQVCRRSVCWDCKERCKWEREQELQDEVENVRRVGGNRIRADSMLQGVEVREEDMLRKMGIEQGRTKSPIETLGGIEERMGV